MVENRVYPCKINGKYYPKSVDIDSDIKEQVDNIIVFLEDKYNDENNVVYKDEEFKNYINFVKSGNIKEILEPSNSVYRSIFDLAILEFGSYELVERLLINSTDETLKEYFENLDKKIFGIQNILIEYSRDKNNKDLPDNIDSFSKIYINFIKNFAPQRLAHYTTLPINFEMLNKIGEINQLALQYPLITEYQELSNELVDFDSIYSIDIIQQVLLLYHDLELEKNNEKRLKILNKIDELTEKGICMQGNNIALLNLTNQMSTKTLESMADGIVLRLNYYNFDENLDISEDFEQLLDKIKDLKSNYSIEEICSENRLFQKVLQIANLDILPDNEKKELNRFLDEEFGRKDIDNIDFDEFDKKIDNKENFSEEEVKKFYNRLMMYAFKKGKMPIKYIEFFLAKIIEDNSEFTVAMNDNQRIIILEHFAIEKVNQQLGNRIYTIFSTTFTDEPGEKINVGDHRPGFIKIRPIKVENQTMSSVLSVITLFHEIRHEEQQRHIDSNQYDHMTYMMIKERILKVKDYGFYERNYATIYEELDAESFSLEKALNFIQTLPFSEEFKKSQHWKDVMDIINKRLNETKKSFSRAKNKKQKDGKLVAVEDSFDQLIFEHPDLIKKYNILSIEYNDDGIVKKPKQIFEEFVLAVKDGNNSLETYDLYKYILFSRIGRNVEECVELTDVDIPQEIPASTRKALNTIRYAVFEKGIEKSLEEK